MYGGNQPPAGENPPVEASGTQDSLRQLLSMDHFSSSLRGFKPTHLLAWLLALAPALLAAGAAGARERSLPPSFLKSAALRPLAAISREVAPPADIEAILAREDAEDAEEATPSAGSSSSPPPRSCRSPSPRRPPGRRLPGGGKLGRLRLGLAGRPQPSTSPSAASS